MEAVSYVGQNKIQAISPEGNIMFKSISVTSICLAIFLTSPQFLNAAFLVTAPTGTLTTGMLAGNATLSNWGNQNSTSDILTFLNGIYSPLVEMYKSEPGGAESGSAAPFYTTTFSNTPSDPSDALIDQVGSMSLTGAQYLLVKDGSQTPAWYFFNISTWNGTDDMSLSGFWPDQGSISHISIFNGNLTTIPGGGPDVPEPSIAVLFGLGMISLIGNAAQRRRRKLS